MVDPGAPPSTRVRAAESVLLRDACEAERLAGKPRQKHVVIRNVHGIDLRDVTGKRMRILDEIGIAEPTFASVVYKQLPLVARRRKRVRAPRRRAVQAAV